MELPADRPADLPLPALHAPMTGVSTDTRTLKPGNIFFALKGDRFDGHRFLIDAAKSGASALVIDDESALSDELLARAGGGARTEIAGKPPGGFGVLKVADTGRALLRLAQAYRQSLSRTRVVAVCGSNGKTTTTRLIEHLLRSAGLRGTASPKSFNNAVGVPLTVLSAKSTDQFLVCEVGTNAPGEIAILAEVLKPDIAVITSIGREHLEGLGDLAGVAKEEASILWSLNPKGVAVLPSDSPELTQAVRGKRLPSVVAFGRSAEPMTVGTAGETLLQLTDCRHLTTTKPDTTTGLRSAEFLLAFTVNKRHEYVMSTPGEHNAFNALAAIAVTRRFNVDEAKIAAALAAFKPPELRSQVRTLCNGPTLLVDCYNANPDSMLCALKMLGDLTAPVESMPTMSIKAESDCPRRRVAILGDMLELGQNSQELHDQIGRSIAAMGPKSACVVDLAVFIGDRMRHAADALAAAGWPTSKAVHLSAIDSVEHREAVAGLLRPGDLVLLKASRGMELERLIPSIEAKFGVSAESAADPNSNGTLGAQGTARPEISTSARARTTNVI